MWYFKGDYLLRLPSKEHIMYIAKEWRLNNLLYQGTAIMWGFAGIRDVTRSKSEGSRLSRM